MKFMSAALICLAMSGGISSSNAFAADSKPSTIASLYQAKAGLVGQAVSVKGKVVKVNNDILGRNWIHIKDGTGDAQSNDLALTSKQTAEVGDIVVISGVVAVNKDFGSGYEYALLIEDATIKIKK